MSSFSLGPHAWGGPAGVYPRVLQKGDNAANLTEGYALRDGAGVMLPLWMQEDGFGPISEGGFRSVFKSLATANREVAIADKSGTLYPGTELMVVSPADNSTSITSPADVSGMSIALAANTTYEFAGSFLCTSAATATGVHLNLTGPNAQTDRVWMEWSMITGTTLTTNNIRRQQFSTWGTAMENLDSPYTGAAFEINVRGWCRTSATVPVDPVKLRFDSEVNASQVQVLTGSWLKFRKIDI